mmetsp:Transcript_43294/g.74951  ORF Transcript_43294/g.74951 Transcript_43294/m.74951 type:complete len:353 (-) Transcript_43294:4068-5126(-)
MSVAFKRQWQEFNGIDGTFHVERTDVYHNSQKHVFSITEEGVRAPAVRLNNNWLIRQINDDNEDVITFLDPSNQAVYNPSNENFASATLHRFHVNGVADHNMVNLVGNNALTTADVDPNVPNTGKQFRMYIKLRDENLSETHDWFLARSANNDQYLSLITRDGNNKFTQAHAFGKDTFRTRNVVIMPEEDSYNVAGGTGTLSRRNYIRFNYGRNWCISSEAGNDAGNGQISENALYIRCGSGGADEARMRFEPRGVFMRIPEVSGTMAEMRDDANIARDCIVFNRDVGHLFFKYYKEQTDGSMKRFLKKINLVDVNEATGEMNDQIGRLDENDVGTDMNTNVPVSDDINANA